MSRLDALQLELAALGARIADFERRHPYATEAAVEARRTHEAFAAYYESGEYRRAQLIDRLKALRAVLTEPAEDLDYLNPLAGLAVRALAVAAIVLGRTPVRDRVDGCFEVPLRLGAWDYQKLYAGWEETILEFSPRQVRYSIFRDGDWYL